MSETNSLLQQKEWVVETGDPGAYAGWDLTLRITASNFNYPIIDDIVFNPPPGGTVFALR